MSEKPFDARLHTGDPTYVYVISQIDKNGEQIAPVKVGIARDVEKRIKSLQTGCPFKIGLVLGFYVPRRDIALYLERRFHERESHHRSHGEWFDMTPGAAMQWMIVNMIVLFRQDYGLEPEFAEKMLRRCVSDEVAIDVFIEHLGDRWPAVINLSDTSGDGIRH